MPSNRELLEFVLAASRSSLSDLWLVRLNEADVLEKQLRLAFRETIPKIVEARAQALLAEFLRDHGEELIAGQVSSSPPPAKTLLMEAAREPRNASPPKSARRCGSKSA